MSLITLVSGLEVPLPSIVPYGALDWLQSRPLLSAFHDLQSLYDELRMLDDMSDGEYDQIEREYSEMIQIQVQPQTPEPDKIPPLAPNWYLAYKLRERRREELTRILDHRRVELRSIANELSRPRLRRLKLLDLPTEILCYIVNLFRWQRKDPDWESEENLEVIRGIRLVCRRLHKIATPLLFRILRLSVTTTSLAHARRVLENPLMASGVERLQLSLRYCPEQPALDYWNYLRHADLCLEEILVHAKSTEEFQRCKYDLAEDERNRLQGPADHDVDDAGKHHKSFFWEVHDILNTMDHVMIETLRALGGPAGDNGNADYKPKDEFEARCQRLMRASHERFRTLHEEQYKLLESREFVTELAKLVARMPRTPTLFMTDYKWRFFEREEPKDVDEFVVDLLSQPWGWDEIEHMWVVGQVDVKMACVRLLSELPIALYRAGVRLETLEIGVMPMYTNFIELCPQLPPPPDDTTASSTPTSSSSQPGRTERTPWHDLIDSCASLTTFHVLPSCCDCVSSIWPCSLDKSVRPVTRKIQLREYQRQLLNRYFGSIIYGCAQRNLRSLRLSLSRFYTFVPSRVPEDNAAHWNMPPPPDPRPAHALEGLNDFYWRAYDVSQLLNGLPPLPKLREFELAGVSVLKRGTLAAFILGAIPDRSLRCAGLDWVELEWGDAWTHVLDCLRQKIDRENGTKTDKDRFRWYQMHIGGFKGGLEFTGRRPRNFLTFCSQVQKYMMGNTEENPCRRFLVPRGQEIEDATSDEDD